MNDEQTIELYSSENRKIKQFWPDWKIESQIGRGAYGTVYKAMKHEHNLKDYSAIKIISIPQDVEYDQLRAEFPNEETFSKYLSHVVDGYIKEIELMRTLQGSENVVLIHDYKCLEKTDKLGWDIYLRMELLTPLNEYMKTNTLDEAEIRRIGIDVCKALEKCEKHNIIHRDIKPENMFRSNDGVYKLGDFGIAKSISALGTASLSHKGTESYMAPEVFSSSDYDQRADIYSLGIVLYRLLNNNCYPFLDSETQYDPITREKALRSRIKGDKLPSPQNASPDMAKIVLKAAEHDVGKRYLSASAMRRDLENMQVGAVVPVRKVNWMLLMFLVLGLAAVIAACIFVPKLFGKTSDQDGETSSTAEDTIVPDDDTSDVSGLASVPYVIGATEADALNILKQNGFADPVIERKEDATVEAGKVISQSISAYEQVDKETVITLVVSMGPAKFKMPSVKNKDYAEAKQMLEAQGLVVVPHFQKDDSVAENIVINQNIDLDTEVKAGDTVELVVSSGKTLVTVKNVVGKTSDVAKTELEGQGFKVNVVEAYSDSVVKGKVISQNPYADSDQPEGSTVTITVSRGIETVAVPNVYKYSENDAKNVLTNAGFKVKVTQKNDSSIPKGSVISQEPKADAKVAKGSEVTIVISLGKKLVTVPDLYNKTEQEAKKVLENLGFKVTVVFDNDDSVSEGCVCAQSVSGEEVEVGSTVTITISSGARLVAVPNVYNKTEQEARKILEELGLKVTTVSEYDSAVDEGRVCAQSVSENQVKVGTTIVLTISKGPQLITVSFDSNGGSTVSSKSVEVGSKYGSLPTPTRANYTFSGWYTEKSGGEKITSDTIVGTISNQTLYARWTPKQFTVTFDANGGSVSPASKTLSFGDTYGTLPTPTRANYVFDGWYTSASGGSQVTSNTAINEAKSITIYAHWSAEQYTITFDANGGTVSQSSKKVSIGGKYGTLPTPSRTGFTFNGWYTAASGGTRTTSDTVMSSAGNKTLYAHWLPNIYYVTWTDPVNATIVVKRVSSPYAGASIATIKSGAEVYFGDVLSITYTASSGYSIQGAGLTSIMVNENITSTKIWATTSPNNYTYNVVYKSSNGTKLGTATVTKAYNTTNTVTPATFSGYDTPGSQSVKWDSTSAKTITFVYEPTEARNSQRSIHVYTDGNSNLDYVLTIDYRNRTANSVEVHFTITATLSNGWNQMKQHFDISVGGISKKIIVAASMEWSSGGTFISTKTSGWITVSLNTTNAVSIDASSNYWQSNYNDYPVGASKSDSWKINIPAY